MEFYPGFPVSITGDSMGFVYGEGVFGPEPKRRKLDEIRSSLLDSHCGGPEDVYCIAMDMGMEKDRRDLIARNLLYGAVTFARGSMGREPVRSQGHIHGVSLLCGSSTCEVYEIWDGKGCVYMQERGEDNAGSCYAVTGSPGDVIIVPPGWVHAAVNMDPEKTMTFGAWCVRDYGFEYDAVRRHGGIAFFPLLTEQGSIVWKRNKNYTGGCLTVKQARACREFGLEPQKPLYRQYRENPSLFDFVTRPRDFYRLWENYEP